jgi:phage-related holin
MPTENALDYIKDAAVKLWQCPALKTLFAGVIFVVRLLWGNYRPAMGAIFILFVLDFILGFGLAAKKHGIESPKLLRGGAKLLIYGVLLSVSYQLSLVPLIGSIISSAVDGYIMVTEGISVMEKIDKWCEALGMEKTLLDPIIKFLKQKRDRIVEEDNNA